MKVRKSERIRGRHVWKAAAVFGTAAILAWCNPMVSLAEATGTVLPNSVNIRKRPDQESEVIGSSTVGKEISIRGKVDASGITWYQVYVDGNTLGYVRADMIEKKGDGDIPTVTVEAESQTAQTSDGAEAGGDAQEPAAAESSGGGAQVDAQETMDLQYASTKVQAKVRPDPSTSNNPVDSLTPGTQVVVSGKSEGSDSKTWYYVTFTASNGSEKTGYIRSDLLELGEMLPVEEEPAEEPTEEPEEPAAAPRNDYELKIETTSDGEEAWYIYDNVTGQKQKLVPLLESSYSQTTDVNDDTESLVKQRIVIVVLAVLLAICVIVMVVMAFKLRDAYYEDYEDDEEDDEETPEERQTARRASDRERETGRRAASDRERESGRRAAADEERRPRRKESAGAGADRQQERRRREREVSYREEPDAEEAVRPARARKAKNFLLDDDEFEFEFLNMDDKDLK